ncbi:MAG TPA: hypothetical protein VLI55_07090 [Bryobacteraceae bacterium]|nr:hypothetical protein [Bryobacteraceae bacterium]
MSTFLEKPGTFNGTDSTLGKGGTRSLDREIVKKAAEAAAIDKLAPHDLRRYVHVFAIWPAASSTKFNSFSVTYRSRRRNITSVASRSSGSL